jgi:hypothetical protein
VMNKWLILILVAHWLMNSLNFHPFFISILCCRMIDSLKLIG